MPDAPEELWNVLESYLAEERLELDDLEVVGAHGGGKTLRVTVDGEGVGSELLGAVSKGISRLLDTHDVIPGSYQLEVSTPGLERKLRRPEHWKKSVGRDVRVKTRIEIEGFRRHEGVLESAGDAECVIVGDGIARTVAYDAVASAKTVYNWTTPAKPGKK